MPRLFDSKQFRTDLQLSGSFSGSFHGDGSSLTNVPASGIIGLNLSQIGSGSATASISPDKGLQVNTSISGSIISGSTLIISPTGSFQHIITDGETIEFRNPSTKAEIGRLKFDPTTGLNVQDNTGARTKIRAGRGEFLSLEAGPVGFNSIGAITGSIISASSTIFANDIEAFAMNVTNFTASFITASTIETSGSNIFGDESSDTHTFVGDIIAENNITASGNIRMQTAAPNISIQRTSNSNNSSIDFIGQAGATGAQIQFSGSSNELTFGTYDGSSVIERLRIEDGTTPNIIITGSTNISGSATSTASFGTYIGDGSGLSGLGGAYGISNSNGVYTYYTTLSASIAAASAGDVVEVFADVVETNPVTILFKDGVNINGNGHTYTLDHSSSMAAFADYEAQETSGTSISCSIHNFNMRRINGDDSSVEFASTIYIHNDTAGADTFLDLRGSTIYSDNGYTYFCSYRHGRVQGGRFIGDRDGGAFQLNAPSNTHYPSLYDAVCDFSLGYAQVGSATNCTFISKGGIYGLQTVTGGDYKISNCSIYAQAAGRGSGEVQGVRIGNTANRLEDCYVSVGGTNNYGVYGATQMRGCTIESSGIGVFASGAGQNISNNRIHSTGHAAASLRTNYSSGTYIYANNTFTSDATSYSTVYYRGEVDTDGTFNNNSIYAEGDNANAHALQITVQANHDCHIYNNTFKVFNPGANCIYANGQDTAFLAGNIYETAGVAVHPNVTQSFTNVPDEQGNIHVTSSLDNSRIYSGSFSGSYVGDGSQLSGVSAFPFSGSAVITGSLIVSQSTVDFSNATSVTLPAATVPLINPQVEYVNCAAITASGATVPLPNGLTFISSSIYEYIEIFINGLRMRYDVDFAPRSTSTIQYFVTIPSGSEITYKSLNRP